MQVIFTAPPPLLRPVWSVRPEPMALLCATGPEHTILAHHTALSRPRFRGGPGKSRKICLQNLGDGGHCFHGPEPQETAIYEPLN